MNVTGLETTCDFRWEYKWTLFSGSGDGRATVDDASSVYVALDFVSEDYSQYPPTQVNVADCQSQVLIEKMEFDGDGLGIIASLISLFEDALRGVVESELSGAVCGDLLSTVEEALKELLVTLSANIDGYLKSEDTSQDDPLNLESSFDVPTDEKGNPRWINFQELSILSQIKELIGDDVNFFIRDNFLNEQGLLIIDPSIISSMSDTLFDTSDVLTETKMTIKSVSIKGLDTFSEVDLLNAIGKYTLQNGMKLDKLSVVVEVEAVISASSQSDAVITAPDAEPITETFTVEFAFEGLKIAISFLIGINTDSLRDLELGSILYIENILSCITGTIDESAITQLAITATDMVPPTLSVSVDEGIDSLISAGAVAFYHLYEAVLIQAMPNFFQTLLRDMINESIDGFDSGTCPELDSSLDGIVDYRDLLLQEEEAVALLGRGGSPYGDLFRTGHSFLQDFLSSTDENGMSSMNSIIASLTEAQSDVEGEIYFPGELFGQDVNVALNGLNAAISLSISDFRISNIDSLGAPLNLLEPLFGESIVLNNTAMIGVGPAALRASFTLVVRGKGDELSVDNEIELGLSLHSLNVLLELLAQMEEHSFLTFPLGDITNRQCWLATIVTPALDQFGVRTGDPTLGIQNLVMTAEKARLDMTCITCSSPLLQEMDAYFESEEGMADTSSTINVLLEFGSNMLMGDFVQNYLDKMLNKAARQCPHSDEYNPNFSESQYEDLTMPEAEEAALGFLIAIIVVVVCIIQVSALVFLATKFITRRRHNRWMKQLNDAQIAQLVKEELYESERQHDINSRLKALVVSADVPLVLKISIPIIICGNIALFLSGHLSLGEFGFIDVFSCGTVRRYSRASLVYYRGNCQHHWFFRRAIIQ